MDGLIKELKEQIIESLSLEDVEVDEIDESEPLFGVGLGLDSIDALELVVMLEKYYKIKIDDIEVGKKAFLSVNALAEFVKENRKDQ